MQDTTHESHTQIDAANLSTAGKDLPLEHTAGTVEQHVPPNEQKKTLLQKVQGTSWDTILVISCVIAVSSDPLFFYIPIINEEMKCLGVDKDLRTSALLLRAVTDVAFILDIFYQIRKVIENVQTRAKTINNNPNKYDEQGNLVVRSKRKKRVWFLQELAQTMPWLSITIDIIAVLPIPQVLMAVFFKMRSSKYLGRRKILDVFLLIQYLPRIYRMHHSSKRLRQKNGVRIRGVFFFFMYILASHILGAFWYFFSIQRETSCWHRACMTHSTSECNFYCDQDISSRNMTFIRSLDEFCLVDVPANATSPYDFGIFLDSLKSGNTGQVNFGKKLSYSFWWGLRNLSNFGTNLETSTYVLENCFAILISIVGLLLFLYLIGNVQTFISMGTEKSEERRKKLQLTKLDMQQWMTRNCLHKDTKNEITEFFLKKPDKIKDVDIENIINILPSKNRSSLKRILCMETLSKVPLRLKEVKALEKKPGQGTKEKVLTSICDFLRPVACPDGRYVYRIGEPLDRMFLITDGLIWMYNTTSISRTTSSGSTSQDEGQNGTGSTCLRKGAVYGDDELLSWASDSLSSLDNLPMSKANVKAHGKVEGFILMAKDLKVVIDKYKIYWQFRDNQVQELAASQTIQKAARKMIKQQSKRDQPKVPQPDTSKLALPAIPPQQDAAVVLEIPSEETTRSGRQVS